LIVQLKHLANAQGKIINRKIVELLQRKSQKQNALGEVGCLPLAWKSFGRNNFEKMVRNLDVYNSGSICYKTFATYCILLKTPVATDANIEHLKKILLSNEANYQAFLAQNPWFVQSESSKDRDYSHPYPRANNIK